MEDKNKILTDKEKLEMIMSMTKDLVKDLNLSVDLNKIKHSLKSIATPS